MNRSDKIGNALSAISFSILIVLIFFTIKNSNTGNSEEAGLASKSYPSIISTETSVKNNSVENKEDHGNIYTSEDYISKDMYNNCQVTCNLDYYDDGMIRLSISTTDENHNMNVFNYELFMDDDAYYYNDDGIIKLEFLNDNQFRLLLDKQVLGNDPADIIFDKVGSAKYIN